MRLARATRRGRCARAASAGTDSPNRIVAGARRAARGPRAVVWQVAIACDGCLHSRELARQLTPRPKLDVKITECGEM